MEFWVKLIEVIETQNQDARNWINANCTHVANDYWLYEGDEEVIHEDILFKIAGEEAIEGYGDLLGSQIIKMVREVYNVDREFLN